MSTSWLTEVWKALAERLGSVGREEPLPTAERWQRIEEVLNGALDLPTAERPTFLDRACAGEPVLRREVESLLAMHDQPGLLDRPAAELVEPLLSPALPALPIRGGRVSHYEILEKVGGGGMGVVYKARDLRLGRAVALKFLPPHLSTDSGAKERFRIEAQAAAALDHPHICTIHQIGETEEGQLFLAMPFYEGETLQARIARGPLPAEEALQLTIQAAQGLARAHERGIVHRDIKPANLIVTAEGVVKILDFGIAKLSDVSLTGPGRTPGTVAYMSPEQARGEPVDHRTDLWSLGVVFYELLTGERPFRGDNEQVVLRAIAETGPAPVASLRPEVSAALEQVIVRALAKRPENRYPTAGELVRDLERVRDGGAVVAPPPGVLPEGERRQAAIVASTLSGYAGLVERLVPEEVERVVRRIEESAAEIVSRHGGVINQFRADELVMLFGVPATHEDDGRRAVRAALELHGRVREVSRETERLAGQVLFLHTGIDAGQVVAQPAEGRASGYRIAGTAVEVAARLSAHAAADEVWISPECQRLISAFFETEIREPLAVRGREQPLLPYRVVRESGIQTRLEAAERAGLTRYVGREEELNALRRCLAEAAGGEGQLVTVVGEAGIGKSRLLYEFRQQLDRGQLLLLQGRCQSYGASVAYLPFLEMLRSSLRLDETASLERQVQQVAARVREIGSELEEFIPLYLHLLSIPSDEFLLPQHLQGEHFRLVMQEALAALLTLSARQQPTVVLLEDWHWADEASRGVLEQIAEVVAEYPLLVVVTCRPGYVTEWGNPSRHAALTLQPLDASAALAMLRSVLHARSFPEELGEMLHERTGGNPFFLEEICQTLLEEGTLAVEEGQVVLTGSLETLDLPDTIQAVIRTRLDRLERDAREVLRLASVVGREFTRGILEHTLPGVGRLPNALQILKAAGLIHQTRVVPDAAYRFKHVLTQETAYASLLEHQRKELHGQVGKAIEDLYPSRLEDHLDRLAYHFSRAEEWRKAVEYGLRSADRSTALSNFSEALQLLERAQGWLSRLPQGSERQELLIQILLRQERLCETLGYRGQQQRIIDDLISLLEPEGDPAQLAEVYVRQGDLYTLLRRFDAAEEVLLRSLRLRRELGDEVGERNTLRSLGLLRWHEDRNEEALAYLEEALALDEEREDLDGILGDLSNMGQVLKSMGALEQARTCLEEALRLIADLPARQGSYRAETPFTFKQQYLLHNLAHVHREWGELEQALEYLQRAVDITTKSRLPIQVSFHFTSIAHVHLQLGNVEESLRYYREAIELTRRARFAPGLAQSLRFLGEVLVGLDRQSEALPYLEEAAGIFGQLRDCEAEARMWSTIAAVQERREKHPDALAAWGKARALCKQGNDPRGELEALEGIGRVTRRHVAEPSLASGYYQEALRLAEGLEDRVAEGRLRNTLGILEWSQREYEEALEHYEQALGVFQALEDEVNAGLMLNSLGVTLRALGRREEARNRLEEAISLHRRTGQKLLEGHALAAIGDIYDETGDSEQALRCYELSLRLRREIGDREGEGWMLHHLARVHLSRGLADQARELTAQASQVAAEGGSDELREACEQLRRMPGL